MVKIVGVFATLYTIVLAVGSLIRPVQLDTHISNFDKLFHAGAYFGLALLWLSFVYLILTKRLAKNWVPTKYYVSTAVALVFFGIVIELLQGAVTTYRTADYCDALANTAGVILGSLLFVLLFKKIIELKS